MKNKTKCFLTVLITYISMCIVSFLLVYFLIKAGSSPVVAVIAALIVCIVLSIAGVLLKNQPKSVLISFVATVCSSWLIIPMLYHILANFLYSPSLITEIISMSAMIFGFPGFIFAMAMGENLNANPISLYFIVYILCGLVPVIVTFVTTKIKK